MASRCARKSTSLRAAKRWLADEMEIMEALTAARRVRPIDTVASKQKLRVLGEFFPSVAVDVRRDVLVAANYREDVAAAMLGDLTRDMMSARTQEPTELLFVDLHSDDDASSEFADEEDWSEVAAASNGTDAWVVIQDDWEVVDKDGEKVRTFADVLLTVPMPTAAVTSPKQQPALLSRLSVMEHTPVPSSRTLKKIESDPTLPTYELERGVKSFGARKRHLLKHHR